MDLYLLAEGPFLWAAFLIFVLGTIVRVVLTISLATKRDKVLFRDFSLKYVLATMARWLLPLNKTVAKNPVFTIAGYIFHICLIVVPIWLSGHIMYWEMSRFGWSWTAIPDALADWMTILFLAIACFFLLRRIFSKDIRLLSTFYDYILLIIVALPFLTGYFLSHGTLDHIDFFGNNMMLIHMLSGELMLISIPFTKLNHFVLFFFSRSATAIEFGRRGYSM